MSISLTDVEKVAYLAKLDFTELEKMALTEQLNQIVEYVEKLNEIDTENIQPTSHVINLHNVFRDDIVGESLPQDEVLKNSPKQKHGHFSVPKVIG